MFCPHCGTRAVEHSRFCHHCAAALPVQQPQFNQPASVQPVQPLEASTPQPDKWEQGGQVLKRLFYLAAVLIVLFIGGAIVVGLVKESARNGQQNTLGNFANSINAAVKTEHRVLLVGEEPRVEPLHYLSWNFEVEPGDLPARVVGRFSARGGLSNDILVYIVDEDGMINVRNGHRAKLYYNSGQVAVGSINVELQPGRYHIVLDNTNSIASIMTVSNDITLVYHR